MIYNSTRTHHIVRLAPLKSAGIYRPIHHEICGYKVQNPMEQIEVGRFISSWGSAGPTTIIYFYIMLYNVTCRAFLHNFVCRIFQKSKDRDTRFLSHISWSSLSYFISDGGGDGDDDGTETEGAQSMMDRAGRAKKITRQYYFNSQYAFFLF